MVVCIGLGLVRLVGTVSDSDSGEWTTHMTGWTGEKEDTGGTLQRVVSSVSLGFFHSLSAVTR